MSTVISKPEVELKVAAFSDSWIRSNGLDSRKKIAQMSARSTVNRAKNPSDPYEPSPPPSSPLLPRSTAASPSTEETQEGSLSVRLSNQGEPPCRLQSVTSVR